MIQFLPTFQGLDSENSYLYIREFEEVVATFLPKRQLKELGILFETKIYKYLGGNDSIFL